MKEDNLRKIYLFPTGNTNTSRNYPDNTIISSKYTLINFIPKNLFGQFRRVVNFFFLVLIILQFSIDIPVNPIPYVAAFAFVIGVTAIKQGYEDWQIHRSDNFVNNALISVFDKSGKISRIKSRHIKVGQIIRLSNNDSVPSDILLLGCTSESGLSIRQCQITTANLDGEANLKLRFCPPQLPNLKDGDEKFLAVLQQASISLEYDQPNSDLYKFMGTLQMSSIEKPIPLTMDNVLLRGSTIRNCQYVYGCTIYTGKETRLSLNSAKTKSNKFSTVERTMNKIVASVFAMLLIMCSIAVVMYFNMRDSTEISNAWYLPSEEGKDVELGLITFISFLVLISYAVPVSLSVTIELQKFGCSQFFIWDKDMRCPTTGNMAICNTSDLNEELGQIEYLFTDKTGTLTENNLNFTCCSINGKRYNYSFNETGSNLVSPHNEDIAIKSDIHILEFLKLISLCHTVQTMTTESKPEENQHSVQYIASSLDEEALVVAASSLGVKYLAEVEDEMTISVQGEIRKYIRHLTLEFDADRKCMSVIVEDDKGKILVLTKGAESSLLPKCVDRNSIAVESTMQHVEDFAKIGLRTLVLACKEITSEELQRYKMEMENLRRDANGLKALYSEIEQNLTILGATGVEDQLQDGVPETLQALKEAGIKIWMLTGDKLETAVNVALACGLVSSENTNLDNHSFLSTFADIDNVTLMSEKLKHVKNRLEESRDSTLVMDGVSLATGLEGCKALLCETTLLASQVVFCRMAPLQKAQVVRMIKSYKGKDLKTCAVGDGGNDVAMIQEAHIGIGIMGKEGRQATRASDFAVSRFKFLQKAILVHGYWYYQRLATLVVYFFYRGTTFIFQQFLYGFSTAFSAQTIFHSTYVMLYTILFASTPVLVYGLTEQSKSAKELLNNPQLYKELSRNSIMSPKNCVGWVLNTIWHFLICWFVPWYIFQDYNALMDWGSYSLFICSLVVAVTDLKIVVETKFFNWISFGAQVFSYATMFFFYSVYCQIGPGKAEWLQFSYYPLLSQPEFWLSILLVSTLGALPDILVTLIRNRNSKNENLTGSRSELMRSYEMKKV